MVSEVLVLGGGAGFSQMGGQGNYFISPGFDILLRMQDINLKRRLIGGELTYRITALPEGKKAIHLYNVPGGKFDFGNMANNNYRVWYWYYETEDREDCLAKNPDIVRLPSDVNYENLTGQNLIHQHKHGYVGGLPHMLKKL